MAHILFGWELGANRGHLTRIVRYAAALRAAGHTVSIASQRIDGVAAEGGGTWTPFHAEVTPPRLARAHALGLRVVPWTVNDLARMAELAAWGVDGLITDRPDLFPRA